MFIYGIRQFHSKSIRFKLFNIANEWVTRSIERALFFSLAKTDINMVSHRR